MTTPTLSKPARLSLRYIQPKPKQVGFVGDDLEIKIPLSPKERDDLEFLIDAIEAGQPIPDRFYRPSMDRRGDQMLARDKIMHLHLDGPSNALVYLIQYEDAVLMIQVNTHVHLDDKPEGKKFRVDLINKAERELHRVLASSLTTALNWGVSAMAVAIGTSVNAATPAQAVSSPEAKEALAQAIRKMMGNPKGKKPPT